VEFHSNSTAGYQPDRLDQREVNQSCAVRPYLSTHEAEPGSDLVAQIANYFTFNDSGEAAAFFCKAFAHSSWVSPSVTGGYSNRFHQ
jgi:hypothetical protein